MSETIAHTSEHPWFSFYLLFTSHSLLIAESPAVPPSPNHGGERRHGAMAHGAGCGKKKKKRRRGPWTGGPADPTCVESPAALLCVTHRLRQPQHGPPVHAKTSAAAPARTFTRQPPHSAPNNCAMECERFPSSCLFFFSLSLSLTVKL